MEDYPYAEELANALTHGIAVAIFIVLCPLIISLAVQSKSPSKIVGACFFSFGLLAVYLSSTLFHAISEKMAKDLLHTFDLLSIYLLICGTYTAFIQIYLKNWIGNTLLVLMWFTSAIGITLKIIVPDASFVYSLALYLILGWVGIFLIKPLWKKMTTAILSLIVAGGLFYTFGTYFIYNDHIKYYHAIWHLFVLAGSLAHWSALLLAIQGYDEEAS